MASHDGFARFQQATTMQRRSVLLMAVIFVVALLHVLSSSGIVQRMDSREGHGEGLPHTFSSKALPLHVKRTFKRRDVHVQGAARSHPVAEHATEQERVFEIDTSVLRSSLGPPSQGVSVEPLQHDTEGAGTAHTPPSAWWHHGQRRGEQAMQAQQEADTEANALTQHVPDHTHDDAQAVIHSTESWLPRPSLAHTEIVSCSCPAAQQPPDTRLFQPLVPVAELRAPARLRVSHPPTPPIQTLFSEVYVLNVAARDDRAHYMCELLRFLNIPALFWPAFPRRHALVREYATSQRQAVLNPCLNYTYFTPKGHYRRPLMSMGAIACWASHREVWIDAAARQLGPVLILEDDIDMEVDVVEVLGAAMGRLPSDWAIVWFGHCYEDLEALDAHEKVAHRLYRAMRPGCTHAYALRDHRVAAALIEEIGHDLGMPLDMAMSNLIRNESGRFPAYVMLPPPIVQLPRLGKSRQSGLRVSGENPSDVTMVAFTLPDQQLHRSARFAFRNALLDSHPRSQSTDLCDSPLFSLQSDPSTALQNYTDSDYLP